MWHPPLRAVVHMARFLPHWLFHKGHSSLWLVEQRRSLQYLVSLTPVYQGLVLGVSIKVEVGDWTTFSPLNVFLPRTLSHIRCKHSSFLLLWALLLHQEETKNRRKTFRGNHILSPGIHSRKGLRLRRTGDRMLRLLRLRMGSHKKGARKNSGLYRTGSIQRGGEINDETFQS